MRKRVLLVDPDLDRLLEVQGVLEDRATVTVADDFLSARKVLREQLPDVLVTNLRLRDYNGIQLALLANSSHTRCVVYAQPHDLALAREVQTAGAFYVHLEHLPFVLAAFVRATVPPHDRRDPTVLDRRKTFRNGRRSTDLPALAAVFVTT